MKKEIKKQNSTDTQMGYDKVLPTFFPCTKIKMMINLKEKFEVVWNTKHKDEIKMVFKVPVGNNKKW
ncbi:MAG: hypothetical protein ACOC3V_00650, partial [bacterium]